MIESVKGMRDILPQEEGYWDLLEATVKNIAISFGFSRIRTPILEKTDLFVRSVGKQTDIVQKEMYSLKTEGGDALTLRPEMTAPVMRAYIENGMKAQIQPVKLYYIEPCFRHERPQQLRYRQFYQIGFEEIGLGGSAVDTELILIAHYFLSKIGLDNYEFQVNTLGDENCREGYVLLLSEYLKSNRRSLCEVCNNRVTKRPLSAFDCKEEKCQRITRMAPKIIDSLCEPCRTDFKEVLELLDEVQVPYALNPFVVRGLEYYSRTVYEIWTSRDGELDSQVSLGGGGRYDGLAELMGGEHTPGSGFALGVERMEEALKEKGIKINKHSSGVVFLAQLGFQAKKRAMRLLSELLLEGVRVRSSFARNSLSSQLRVADKLEAEYAIIIGEKELYDRSIILRDMKTGNQETLEMKDLVPELKNRLNIL